MSSTNRFCGRCGKAVPSLDNEFCTSCGSPVSAARDEPTEEPISKESIPHSASPEPSTSREDVAVGGKKGALPPPPTPVINPIAQTIVAVVLWPVGLAVGLWYMCKKRFRYGILLFSLSLISLSIFSSLILDSSSDSDGSTLIETSAPTKSRFERNSSPLVASEAKPSPTAIPTAAPIVFSDEQASAFLLVANDFPKDWSAKRDGMFLEAKLIELPSSVKVIKITLETHEDESAAQTAFFAKKAEAQTTIDDKGISGYKLEDVKKYPLFVWNASSQANIAGVEKWTVIGVYGNITVKVLNEGSFGAPRKGFAVDIAKKQMDKIMGN